MDEKAVSVEKKADAVGRPAHGGKQFGTEQPVPKSPGRPKIPFDQKAAWAEIKASREESRQLFQQHFRKFESFTVRDLELFSTQKTNNAIECIIARALMRILSSAKIKDVMTLRNLMCGADPKQIEISGPEGRPIEILEHVPTEELLLAYRQLQSLVTGREPIEVIPCSSENLSPQELSQPVAPSLPLLTLTEG